MATLSPAREMMTLASHTDKRDVILFHSNPEISHGSKSRMSNGSLMHSYHHHHHQNHNHYSQSDIPKYSVSFSEPQIDHGRNINGGVLNTDYHVLRMAEVQIPSLDYDNVVPLTRINHIEKKGGVDATVHSINEHHASSVLFPPLDSGDAVAEGGGFVNGESGRHPSCEGYKGEPGDSRNTQGGSLNGTEGDQNFTCVGAETSREADARKSQMGNDLFSARTANVSDARADTRENGNKERLNNTGRPNKGIVYGKYTATRVTDTTYCKLHAETTFIDQPNLSYGVVRSHPETQRCDKLIDKTTSTRVYDVDLAVTNKQPDRYRATGELSIIPDTVSTKHVGAKDITEDRRFIIMPASVCTGTGGLSTREPVISTSSNDISSSATIMSTSTSVLSPGAKDEPTEAVVSLSGADFSTNSRFETVSSVANTSSIRQPLSEKVAKHTETTTSHNYNGSLIGPKLDLTATHIPSSVVLLPELPMIVITPSIPEATSSPSPATSIPSPALSSPDRTVENISHSQPCESLVGTTDNVEHNHVIGDKDISSTEIKASDADDIPLSKPAPVGGVKVLPSKFTFNVSKFKETKRADSLATDVLSTSDTSAQLSTGPMIQAERTNGAHHLPLEGVGKDPQHSSELSSTACTLGSTTTNVSTATSMPGITVPSSVMVTTDHSAPGAAFTTNASQSGAALTSATASGAAFTTNASQSGAALASVTVSGAAFTTNASESRTALTTSATVSGAAFTTEKAATSSCVLSEYKYPPASAATDTVAFAKQTGDYWSDYAVPSDLPLTPTLESSAKEVTITSNGENESIEDHTKTTVRIVNGSKDRKDTFTSHSVLSVSPDKEAIYATPIPKSQRLPVADSEHFPGKTTPAEVPLKPPRSPVSDTESPQVNKADDDAFDDVIMRKPERANNQMKKSTTTGTLHSYSSDYSNIPNTVSHKYDYFSLGRRPKRPRIKTLTDSQGMAVSLDMLLRSRRQSVVDMSIPADNEQTLSVDDILKSCLEFDDDCSFYRSRTNSDVVKNSSKKPLSFREVHDIKLLNVDLPGKEKQGKHNAASSKPILKKGDSSNRKHDTLGAKKTNGTSDIITRNKTQESKHSKPPGTRSYSSSTHGQENEKQIVISKKEATKRPDSVKSYILSDSETGTEYHASAKDTKSHNSSAKSESSSSHNMCNPDYESIGDTCTSQLPTADTSQVSSAGTSQHPSAGTTQPPSAGTTQPPSAGTTQPHSAGTTHPPSASTTQLPSAGTPHLPPAVVFSSTGSRQHHPTTQEDACVHVDTTSARPSAFPEADPDVSVTILPPPPAAGSPTPTIHLSISDNRPSSLPHLKQSFVTISTPNGHTSASSPVAASSSTEASSLSPDFRDLSSSFSDRPSPSLSTGFGSESAVTSNGGVLSLLSVDVRETSPGDSPSPGQRSPSCDPKLEAAEALKWLRAAGFPQYAQMFDDGQFPVDMGIVERDHDFLDKDSLQSLFRRLETLNRYAGIKRDSHPCKKSTSEEEDEDDFCALSERWEYQKSARRWSRKDLAPSCQLTTVALKDDLAARSGSHDSLLADQDSGSQVGDSPLLKSKISHKSVIQSPGTNDMVSVSHQALAAAEITPGNTDLVDSPMSPPLRRATSEKTKTAKNLFKKMEGMKSGKSRRQSSHRNIVEISGPVVADKQNMQAKLEKLNCVDIPQGANTQLSPRVNVSESSDRGLASSTESHHLPSSTCGAQPSPPSPHPPSSPRPHSDFLLRSKEGRPHVPPQTGNHTRPSSTSTNQRPSLAHDSSFEEYYQAQTAFLQNLQSSPRSTAESVRKNNSETNLMEIFLVPQDHQPGRFPRVLQNGYIETEACGTAVNVRTGSVRLGRNSCMKSDHGTASLRSPQLSEAESLANRLSVYDNCSSPSGEERQGKRSEESQSSSAIPSATEVRSSGESKQTTDSLIRESTEVGKHGFIQEVNSDSSREDSRDTSRESSVVRTTWNFSHQPLRNPDHERSVSFESSTSSQSPDDSTLVNVEDLASTDSKSSKLSSSDSLSSKSKVTHSSSVDSYFRGISSQSGRPVSDSSTTMPANTFQENYDEFDRILQELYKNINDLTTFMDKDKNEKTPRLVRAATSPLPAGSPHPHSPLHVATAPVRPILRPQQNVPEPKSPSSATSDLVHSPASPGSPQDSNEPLDFYGALELDHENSSSGGEGSNTAESGSEDQALTDISQDDSLDQIIEVSRERRDSGVGHSLTRAPSDRRRKKIRWHSFQKSHRPDISSRAMQINSLTVSQLVRLQKLSLLRLTGIMEKCLPVNKSGWNWMVPRFMKRHKAPDFSDKNVFGVPLSVMAQRTGQPLPQCVLYAMRYLRRTCPSAVGIFRKSGVKSKIQQLRDYLEAHPDTTNFDGENAYNVADMLKTFFRDLPECLLTNKMSETFRSIYTYVPQPQRLDAIQAAILLLPDENREVLQSILLFLSDISEHEADHQMNASNLAVCFTPTVFHLGPRQSVPYSPKRNRKNSSGVPDPREIMEQKAAHECLLMMITDCKKLFTVPSNLFRQLQVQSVAHLEASLPQDIGSCPADVRAFGQEKIQMVLKESHDKNRGWLPTMTIGDVEVFHRKPMDDCLLKEWKLIVDIEAPPVEVLRRIMHERHTWDEDLLSWSVVERLDQHSDIFQFVLNSMAPHPPRNFCVLRYWRSDLNKGACALITMSVEHSDTLEIQGVWAVDLGTYYLMEPCGSGRSRLTYITRVDTRGRMPEWYTKIFGHICANFLDRLKESFKQDASGPETKV